MTTEKPFDWTAKPESLEAKFKLMCRLPYDARVRRRHVLVFGFIIDWFHSKYGDALASVRHVHRMVQQRDPAGKGLYIGEIHGALADLTAWGYLSQEKGKGRRASRYVPVWRVLEPSVQESPNADDADRSVLKSPNTSVLESPNARGRSVLESLNEDPSTLTRSQDPGTGMDEVDCGAATPPPVDALSGTTAGTPQEERATVPADPAKWFDHLYGVYGVKTGKADARRLFGKIAPDVAAFTSMIEAARKWRAAAGGIERMGLARWLRDEKYDEEPRQPREEKAGKPVSQNSAERAKPRKAKAHAFAEGETRLEIIKADVVTGAASSTLEIVAGDEAGVEYTHTTILEHHNPDTQAAGQRELGDIVRAAGLAQIEDSKELLGREIVAVVEGGKLEFVEPLERKPKPVVAEPAPAPARPASNETWPAWMDDAA